MPWLALQWGLDCSGASRWADPVVVWPLSGPALEWLGGPFEGE
jgi:hypothetical protein